MWTSIPTYTFHYVPSIDFLVWWECLHLTHVFQAQKGLRFVLVL
ncbi:hypothetical protein LEP1GSC005_0039 [Leptospira santarosai str. ST188]|nr:hypothetical protein LEP1GSC005_0039 [Leptospira santarosai str. ST188]